VRALRPPISWTALRPLPPPRSGLLIPLARMRPPPQFGGRPRSFPEPTAVPGPYPVTAGASVFAVRLLRSTHGFERGDSILAHPALGPDFALVRLIPARYAQLMELDNAGAIEYLSAPLWPDEVTRLLETHFQTVRRRTHRLAILP
jgi:hypothetical protein